MPLGTGVQLLPRQIAEYGDAAGWHDDVELTKMVATSLGESQGFLSAWHPNLATDGKTVVSQDDGLMQINIPASEVGGAVDQALRTSSHDKPTWDPVATHNTIVGFQLYNEPFGEGHRHWEPWVSYTEGWATFSAWWVWAQNAAGKSVGPWNKTGRYVHRAIIGVANYHLAVKKDMPNAKAVGLAATLADHFDVTGTVGIRGGLVEWTLVPPKPTAPPTDGVGPRPIPNHGQ